MAAASLAATVSALGPHPTAALQPARQSWSPKFIFVGGFHHSGTTLVGYALSANARDPRLKQHRGNCSVPCWGALVTGHMEDEGQHAQSVYPTDHTRRKHKECSRTWSEPLCPPAYESATSLSLRAAKLQEQWRKYVSPPDADVVVEKDPDFGSLLFKLSMFPTRFPRQAP